MTTTSPDQFRLPTSVKPLHYDVTIRTDLEKLVFDGFVKISLEVKEETSKIVLNSAGLELGRASIYSEALGLNQVQTSQSYEPVQQRLTLEFPTKLPAGTNAELRLGFSSTLSGSMNGYYKSAWEQDGKTKYYALTQFEATSARKAFPCWDEPLLKATYSLSLISRAETVNLSNMPAASETVIEHAPPATGLQELDQLTSGLPSGEWKVTNFEKTPLMSSYIVAYANGPFKHIEDHVHLPLSNKTIPLRVYATEDLIHQARFALDIKIRSLPLYEKVFDVPYPLPKLDSLVASDFDAGAMENWGLITGRTNCLLLDPKKSDLAAKKRVASVQCHEVAHMWFGNITTMEWWNYLYLNEGFATLMGEVIIAGKVFPEWRVNSEFITTHLARALNLDAKLSSHPIEVECPDANRIDQIFDSLSYSKAASVLRMLSYYVGEDKFLKGVSLYLKKKLYANSVTTDLWEGISESTGVDIVNFMDNWVSKIGFPVLTVTENGDGIHVRQDRFLETGHAEPKDNETIWNVPLTILSTGSDGKATIDRGAVLSEREKTFAIDTTKPFKLNAGTNGVYRVLYTPERLKKIAEEAAKENSIFTLDDRLGLVHDSLALSRAGLATLSSSLTLIDTLKNEKEYLVWSGIADSLSGLVSTWWENQEVVDKINAFRRSLFVPLVGRLGYEYPDNESPEITQLRTCAITQAASADDEGVIKELTSRFAEYLKTGDDSRIPPDLERVIFQTAIKKGGRAEYEAVVKVYDYPKTPSARNSAIYGMGFVQTPELIDETLKFISKTRDQDVFYFFQSLSANHTTRRPVFNYFMDQFDVTEKRFEGNSSFRLIVDFTLGPLSAQQDLDKIDAFFKDRNTAKYDMSLAQAKDGIRAKVAYIARSTEDVKAWLLDWEKRAA
ncbi:leucyl aminopeptidase [Pluteus cervinus]|uniref:Leucyl aminopeptidase n=1 Tax=Pluteus cervinus TaxID=181527 RepID=A0ACD3B8F5_9AGAR|nr:leucyl aminopeptidase [Pluteus cervinus]